ncbi:MULTISPECIES: L-cystine transporter [Bacillus]|uniref:L-cystine transporter n=1 Tax=Bacillus TaxID=1386 RepID=UPI0003792EFC|nr:MULTISPECIES: L-cystine transporter [Bacillus]
MNTLCACVLIVILLALVYILYRMQKSYVSFPKRVFTGLVMGIAFGALIQFVFKNNSDVIMVSTDWFGIIGNGYVRLLKMIVIPLVMVSIISAIIHLKSSKGLGKMTGLIIAILIFTTLIASGIGITYANLFQLNAESIQVGEEEKVRAQDLESNLDTATTTIPQKILAFIPTNPFEDMTGARPTSTLGVVIFSVFVGIASLGIKRKQPEHFDIFQKVIAAIYAITMRIVTLILRLTPYGILALMTSTIATTSIAGIIHLSAFVIASYVALCTMLLVDMLFITLVGLNPIQFVKKALPALTFAFTSRTSAGTIPLNIKVQTKGMGVADSIANFSATFGASIGQNGCAGIYPSMLAIMIAPTVGINPMEPQFILSVMLIVTISSFGVAGVGGGATFAALIVLSALDLPVGLAGLLISIEPLIDMGRTVVNVSGSMTAGVVSAKLLGEMNTDFYNSNQGLNDEDANEI